MHIVVFVASRLVFLLYGLVGELLATMSSLTLRAVVSLLLLSLGRRAVAQESLAFVFPPPLSAHTPILFTTGRNVNFQWTSTWPTVSLQIWQGPDSEGHNPHLDLLSMCCHPMK